MGHALDGKQQAGGVIGPQLDRGGEIAIGDPGDNLHGIGRVAPQLAQDTASHQQGEQQADDKCRHRYHQKELHLS